MTVHPTAARGFGTNSGAYAKGRPDYPPEVADWLRTDLKLAPGKAVLDLGAGTGKFVPFLLATGASVVAVEPLDAMRSRLIEQHRQVEALAGTAEHLPLADHSLDAVICAQSFHWFATRAAVAEIHRVLKPGGFLGLIWNVRDESVPWVAELATIIDAYLDDVPRYRNQGWRLLFPALGFTPLVERRFQHRHTGAPERVIVDRSLSTSFIAAQPLDRQDEIAAQIRALIARTPALAGKSEVTYPYETTACVCHKLV